MKACKIILIILLIIKSLAIIIEALIDEDNRLEKLLKALISIPIAWLLYWGAGLLDF